ncbi:histone-lysine N-methyltransferase SUVR3 isoform X1 [Arachis ipaensis]|uniref:histone-lysine N-methyltransferase SUVR3 isoform X1 n=1 Tax=Arachis ipaensis TaxID=130454 RepID=UPI000A2B6284|nr:histone-lysine N-methyltransferase SUVR3 isoform X1 [Arachis ipaensis]XP_029151942.1 histone-lysine N-methyltransferase SUVR3 isoform X1 [Arachis hypogaea]
MLMAEETVPRKASCSNDPLIQCADLILPWLTPPELATVSITSTSLHKASASITTRRSSDASRTFENLPVPFRNTVDHYPYAYFLYTPSLILPSAASRLLRQPWGSAAPLASAPSRIPAESVSLVDELGQSVLSGCDCEACGGVGSDCPCLGLGGLDDVGSECGPGCGCGPECGNRLTQNGIAVRVKIVRDARKGWCLHSDQWIRKEEFLFEYAVYPIHHTNVKLIHGFLLGKGELLTTKEARRRHQCYDEKSSHGRFSSALLVVREHLPSGNVCLRLNIDATRIGNVARFVNHSCDGGNLSTKLIRSSGALFPRLCFFASKDIQTDEELTFSYGEIRKKANGLPCFCSSPSCFGTLPSEDT